MAGTGGFAGEPSGRPTPPRPLPVSTPRQFEQWTLTCITAKGIAGQLGVSVERGQTVDVGDVCDAGLRATGPKPKTK